MAHTYNECDKGYFVSGEYVQMWICEHTTEELLELGYYDDRKPIDKRST